MHSGEARKECEAPHVEENYYERGNDNRMRHTLGSCVFAPVAARNAFYDSVIAKSFDLFVIGATAMDTKRSARL